MKELTPVQGFLIDQSFETFEVFTGFETRNRYDIRSSTYDSLYWAVEDQGSIVARILLGGWRPFEIAVRSLIDEPVLTVRSPFRWFFHEATIDGATGEPLGWVRRRWSVLRRRYEVRDAADGRTYHLAGTLLHPWTFEVLRDGVRCGRVVKRWSGLFREASSDADRFEADFPQDWPERHKALLLGAALLLDCAHFESRLRHVLDLLGQFRQ